MGGRGGSSGIALNQKQERKLEDSAQQNDAKFNGWRTGAKYYEYIDSTGRIKRGETGRNTPGGIYKAKYSEQVAAYAKMSTSALEKELKKLKAKSDDNYQKFARSVASKSASQVSAFADADAEIRMINQVLRRRKKR